MNKLAVISVACALSALGAGMFLLQSKPSAKAAKAASPSDTELRAEIARLRSEVQGVSAAQRVDRAALQLSAANAAAPAVAQEPANSNAVDRGPVDPRQLLEERDRATHEGVARIGDRLDQLLTTDTVDTRWRTETTRNVDAIFAEVPNSKVLSTDCGSRLCRVVVERTSVDELRDLPKAITNRAPFDSEVLYRYDMEAKPPRVTIYVTRDGGSMAELARPQL